MVIFVRDSPRVDLPAALRVVSLTVRLLVVDLNDWTEVGSRRTDKPVVIAAGDLLQDIANAPPPDDGQTGSRLPATMGRGRTIRISAYMLDR